MAEDARTFRLDVTYEELDALAWAVWFAAPSALTMHQPPLDTLHDKLLQKRRQILRPGGLTRAAAADGLGEERQQQELT